MFTQLFSHLTHAPLPDWKQLLSILLSERKISNIDLSLPWVKGNDKCYWYSRSAWALLAISNYRGNIIDNRKVQIWLPSFFCNESLEILRNSKVKLSFYPIKDDGSPDLKACNKMLNDSKPDLFSVEASFTIIIETSAVQSTTCKSI